METLFNNDFDVESLLFSSYFSEVQIGTICKNGGCGTAYESPATNDAYCHYHPGCPIFHEGLKYWSCCQKKTTDFAAFMNQKGCSSGKHLWILDVCIYFFFC